MKCAVYCQSHVPKTGPGKLDGLSVGIKAALNVPKHSHLVNDQIRGSGKATFNADALGIKTALTNSKQLQDSDHSKTNRESMAGHFDASALHIQHAVNQTRLQKIYKHSGVESRINEFLKY
ncbi:unnamed protein product [Medioppia subpectinata]|uniref:Uncharacterized protein n=1 Tax=Medioppia subpectinata TaxID=1979941 RepID=A0A7R9KFX7_9ACAR|nr:unnamed protein product [Medioppia subpectinata]CAG2102507.1 unnamed protein product [Medioppia subpectinata]